MYRNGTGELVRQLHSTGMRTAEIARQLEKDYVTIFFHLRKMGLTPHFDEKVARCKEISKSLVECKACRKPTLKIDMVTNHGRMTSVCRKCCNIKRYSGLNSGPERFLKNRSSLIKHRCSVDGTPFNLNGDYLIHLYLKQNGLCFYTDIPMIMLAGRSKDRRADRDSLSLDRIVPAIGYVKGNVVLCTNRINTVKNDLSLDEISRWMPEWYMRICKFQAGARQV